MLIFIQMWIYSRYLGPPLKMSIIHSLTQPLGSTQNFHCQITLKTFDSHKLHGKVNLPRLSSGLFKTLQCKIIWYDTGVCDQVMLKKASPMFTQPYPGLGWGRGLYFQAWNSQDRPRMWPGPLIGQSLAQIDLWLARARHSTRPSAMMPLQDNTRDWPLGQKY